MTATTIAPAPPAPPVAAPVPIVAERSDEYPNVARSGMIGALVGFVVSTIAVTVGGSLAGIEPGAAFGLGAFTGMWGGAGFGFMMGATIPLGLHMERSHATPAATTTDPASGPQEDR